MKHLKTFEKTEIHKISYDNVSSIHTELSSVIADLIQKIYLENTNFVINHYYQAEDRRTISIRFTFIEEETIELVKKIQTDLKLPKWFIYNETYSFDITENNVNYIKDKLELLIATKKYNL